MSLMEWQILVYYLDKTYGCDFGVGEEEDCVPSDSAQLEEAWFICPHCGESIYYSDYGMSADLRNGCSICGEMWE